MLVDFPPDTSFVEKNTASRIILGSSNLSQFAIIGSLRFFGIGWLLHCYCFLGGAGIPGIR